MSARLLQSLRQLPAAALAALAALAAAALLLAAGAGHAAGQGGTSATPLLVVEQSGGFVPVDADFARPPDLYVTQSGRLVLSGPQIAIFPPPALANLRSRQLTPRALARLRQLATAAGLERTPPAYGRPPLADATTTQITYRAASGRTYVHRIYALGAVESPNSARRRVERFVAALRSLEQTFGRDELGLDRPYAAPAFEIKARRAPASGPSAAQKVVSWPVGSVLLAEALDCTPVTGPDSATLRRALARANQLTRWRQQGRLYVVANRPVLPGELPCR